MAPIPIPEGGLVLNGVPCSKSDNDHANAGTQLQVMRLDLADDVLEGILKASRMGKDIHMSFGKNVTLHYGNRSQQLLSIAQPTHSELYNYTPDREDELRFAGILTHKMAQKKVQENTAGADAALAALQSKMASHQQNKQSKQIKILSETPTPSPNIKSTYPRPKPANPFAAMRSQVTKKAAAPLGSCISRSIPSSPAVAASRPSQATPNAPRSAPAVGDEKALKMQALKIPLLHLVAIRPMSLKFLANKVGCSQEECKQVLEKIGRPARLDPDKWDLSDKAFKDLDVWKFAYELDDDRGLAIEHAISAYDRMRLSRDDKLWQLLLPKEKRGKGVVLSKLQLHQGPIQQSNTPRIHVERTTEDQLNGNASDGEGDEKHHLAPGDATPMARSQAKKRVSAQEAQSKRLLSTKPKKAAAAPQMKEAVRKKVTKKGGTTGPNVKSTEFVHDSDEDEDEAMKDAAKPAPKPANTKLPKVDAKGLPKEPPPGKRTPPEKTLPAEKKPPPQKTSSPEKTSPPDRKPPSEKRSPRENNSSPEERNSIKALQQLEKDRKRASSSNGSVRKTNGSTRSPSTVGTPGCRHRLSDASQSSTSTSKLSRQRTTSSPLKPSPLGSSPPTNASDLENDNPIQHVSNSSTSSTPLMSQARNPPANSRLRPDAAKRLPTPAEASTEASLKRKADNIDSGIHNHTVPLSNGHISPAAKRAKTSAPSPPAMDSSSSDSSPFSNNILEQAQRFKDFYVNYEKIYREVTTQPNPAPEKLDNLAKLHRRLQSMKDDINRAAMQH
ncbi:MAG: hypothetical protein Q9181_003349 [Wetmoreana brouardii]